jgi:glycerate 2-kinase
VKSHRTLRVEAGKIWSAALRAVDPEPAVRSCVRMRDGGLIVGSRQIKLEEIKDIWVIGAGKAAAPMGQALESVLGRRVSGGLLVTKYGHGLPLKRIDLLEAGHPLPDANGLAAGGRLVRFARENIKSSDLVFCLLSGGGSALLVAPATGISLEDKLECTRLLLRVGANIHEMNAIRKHLSDIKGGGLARLLCRATVASLILSDVVGDSLDTIASGPLVPDQTTFADCLEILRKFAITDLVPSSVRHRLEEGAAGRIPETPKQGDPVFRKKENWIVGSNAKACTSAAAAARRLGYHTLVLSSQLEGDTGEATGFHMSVVEEVVYRNRPLRRPACLISGGETTVRVKGSGKGGRNQEFVLNCAGRLARIPAPIVVASIGTDGTDGPTDAAGAIADNTTLSRALKFGSRFLQDSLNDNNSYEFFRQLGDLIVTGPTRTNVMDLRVILVG